MKAREIAKKYVGKVVNCKITKSSPVNCNGKSQDTFDGRIVGWKMSSQKDPNEYVLLEVLPPAQTNFALRDFKTGCHFTFKKRNLGAYGKRLLPEEIILPIDEKKKIAEFPNVCPACKSPAFVSLNLIDCSNQKCVHKYKTRDAKELFLPPELRPVNYKNPDANDRPEVDKDNFLICQDCKVRATDGIMIKGILHTRCKNGHKWSVKPQVGDKLAGLKDKYFIFNGKVFKG